MSTSRSPITGMPNIDQRVSSLENRYTDVGLNTEVFPISDAIDSDRSDISASSKAVKTAYDAGTRYATTEQQGQVILSHDVESGAQDRALTPFGAKTALDELEKTITDRLDNLESSLNERIEQIIKDLESKFNELNIKIEGRLPLFDSRTVLSNKRGNIVLPTSGSLWFYTLSSTYHSDAGTVDPSDDSRSSSFGCAIAAGGTTVARQDVTGAYAATVVCWRIFA